MIAMLCVCAIVVGPTKINHAPLKDRIAPGAVDVLRYALLGLAAALFFGIRIIKNFILSRPFTAPTAAAEDGFSEPIQTLIETSVTTYVLSGSLGLFGLCLFWLTGRGSDFYIFFVLSLTLLAVYFPRYADWEEWMKEVERGIDRAERSLIRSIMVRFQKRVGKVSEYVWLYPSGLGDRLLIIATLGLALLQVLFLVPFIGFRGSLFLWGFAAIHQVPHLLFDRGIEIDRRREIINKWWGILQFRRNKFYELSNYNSITLYKKLISRYGTWPVYVIVLVGPSSSLKLFDTTSGDKARKYSRDLAEFLEFELVDRTGQWELI